MFVAQSKSKKLYCFLCRESGCTRWKCNVLQQFEKVPGRILRKNDTDARDKLSSQVKYMDNHVLCLQREEDDKRILYSELPRKMKALIVHKKYAIHKNLAYCKPEDNTCIECTLLGDRGLVIDNYDKALFQRACVSKYIDKSPNNLIVDNLS